MKTCGLDVHKDSIFYAPVWNVENLIYICPLDFYLIIWKFIAKLVIFNGTCTKIHYFFISFPFK